MPAAKPRAETADHRRPPILRMVALAYSASVPFDPIALIGGRTLPAVLGILLVLTWLLTHLTTSRRPAVPSRLFLPTAGLLGWATMSLLWAPASIPITGMISLTFNILVVYALADTLRDFLWQGLMALSVGASVVSIWLIVSPTIQYNDRATIGTADENELAFQLCLGFTAFVWLFVASRVPVLILVVPGALCLNGVLLTGSRTGFAALIMIVAAGVLFGIFSERARSWKAFLLAGLVLAGAYLSLALGLISERVLEFAGGQSPLQESARERIEQLYLQTSSDWWLFGVGYGADAVYLEATEGVFLNAHGLFFKSWVEMGVVGLLLVLILLLAALTLAYAKDSLLGYLLLFAPVLAFALTLAGLNMAGFWFVVALSASTSGAASQRPVERYRGTRHLTKSAR